MIVLWSTATLGNSQSTPMGGLISEVDLYHNRLLFIHGVGTVEQSVLSGLISKVNSHFRGPILRGSSL